MRTRTKLAAGMLLAAAATTIGFSPANAQPAVRTSGVDGICEPGQNYCWRVNGTAIDLWARDIAGDSNQQFFMQYDGTVGSLGNNVCKTASSTWANLSWPVYTIFSESSGHNGWAVEESGNKVLLTSGVNGPGTNWVVTANGAFISCAASDSANLTEAIIQQGVYAQLDTGHPGFTAFQDPHVKAKGSK